MYDLCCKSSNRIAFPFNKHCSIQRETMNKMHRGTSLEHILKEITNFGGLEAETQASLNGLMGLETRIAKAKSVDTLNQKPELFENIIINNNNNNNNNNKNHKNNKFKDLLVNDNLIIIEKTPKQTFKDIEPNKNNQIEAENKQNGDLPMPNTVRRCKDIFETLSNNASKSGKISVGRSISVRVTSADWKRAGGSGINIKLGGLNLDQQERCRTLPTRLAMPQEVDIAVEEARDWLNACSPVSPDVIQKLRERGTSMTFFGRPAYTPSPSPVSDVSDGDWKKPRIIGITHKVEKSIHAANKAPSSLGSSSTCSDEELHFTASFDLPSSDNELHQRRNEGEVDDVDSGHEDYHSYDVVFLDGTYTRSNTHQLGFIKKGVWLRDPFWSGSNYIVYDFRGSQVIPHIKLK